MKLFAFLVIMTLMLGGCAAAPRGALSSIALPVLCTEPTPVAPVWPTSRLKPGTDIYTFVVNAQAEIELREGYEGQLRAALGACKGSAD